MSDLRSRSCVSCAGGKPLDDRTVAELINEVPDWTLDAGTSIHRMFTFRNFHETMAFVNAAAWIAHREDHHPDLRVTYKTCRVSYTTHAVGGLTENDFICAVKIDALTTRESIPG